jgi:hypothetical protein
MRNTLSLTQKRAPREAPSEASERPGANPVPIFAFVPLHHALSH